MQITGHNHICTYTYICMYAGRHYRLPVTTTRVINFSALLIAATPITSKAQVNFLVFASFFFFFVVFFAFRSSAPTTNLRICFCTHTIIGSKLICQLHDLTFNWGALLLTAMFHVWADNLATGRMKPATRMCCERGNVERDKLSWQKE